MSTDDLRPNSSSGDCFDLFTVLFIIGFITRLVFRRLAICLLTRPLFGRLLVLLLLRLVFARLFICLMILLAFGRLVIRLHVCLAICLEFSCLQVRFPILPVFRCPDICPYTRLVLRCLTVCFPICALTRLVLRRLAMRPVIRLHPRLIFRCLPTRLVFRRVITQRVVRFMIHLAAFFRACFHMPSRLKRPLTYYTNHVIRICFHFCYSCGRKINSSCFLKIISPCQYLQRSELSLLFSPRGGRYVVAPCVCHGVGFAKPGKIIKNIFFKNKCFAYCFIITFVL